ncbi:hypothetical protein Moror_13308 [Moniliophthora roreri MCA 2997]|uniref:Uncharacterized protein n=1 Tax=Moniliophthora roreri (strain MCA 2997) TaxID=1381753 RepID=V2WSU6_MONRO|nr:hypothetical protein Moror_13308 [Moniliophthora roreri MCA 2997]
MHSAITLKAILETLRQMQKKSKYHHITELLFVKDRKDDLAQLRVLLDDAQLMFLTNSVLAIQLKMSSLRTHVTQVDSDSKNPDGEASLEELLPIEKLLSRGLIGAFTRLASANASKVKKAYKILQLTWPPSLKVNIALTAAEHTSMVLVAVGEGMDFGPLKVVATVVAKIIELAKTANGNKDEALRLGEHVKGMMNELKESLNGTENLPPEESAVIGRSIQPLQALDDIAVMLQ